MAKSKRKSSFGLRKILLVLSLLFILITIPLIVVYVKDSKPRDDRSHAAEAAVASTNSQIEASLARGEAVQVSFLLKQRNEQMTQLAAVNPQAFLDNSYSSSQISRFSADQQSLIEQPIQISGKFVSAHSDNFNNQVRKDRYFIQNSDRTYSLKTVSGIPEEQIKTGKDISVNGYKLNGTVVAQNSEVSLSADSVSPSSDGNSDNISKYLVIPINFKNDRSKPYSINQIINKLFQNDNSSRSYFKNITEDRFFLSGTVMPWIESNIDKNTVCDNPDQLVDYAYNNFSYNINQSNGIIFIFPHLDNCDWSGMGTIGGNPHIIWLSEFTNRVVSHEVEHNMELHHASVLRCSSRCSLEEYGDLSDTLGYNLGNMNGPHRMGLGMMVADGVKVFKSDKTFTIHKLGGSATPQVIKIPQENSNTNIYVEFRGSNSKYSGNTPYEIDKGVMIYRWDGKRDSRTYLMDITVGDGKPYNLVLKDGWATNIGPVRIKQISHDNNSATIRITKR